MCLSPRLFVLAGEDSWNSSKEPDFPNLTEGELSAEEIAVVTISILSIRNM